MASSIILVLVLVLISSSLTSSMTIADRRRLVKAQFRLLKPSQHQADILPLQEDVDNELPSVSDASSAENADEMMELLGDHHFHGDFMSVEDPMSGPKFSKLISYADESHNKKVADEVDELFQNDKKLLHSKIGQKMKRKLTKLLADYTQCPVVYEWKDLGDRFWPRYIRTGTCSQKKSCSFPAGKGCQPAEESHLTLLRKFCGSRRWGKAEVESPKAGSNCRWISIQYPIVTKCSCSC